MHRATMRGALAVVAVAAMTLTACSSKSNTSSSSPATSAAASSAAATTAASSAAATSAASSAASSAGSSAATSGGAAAGLAIKPVVEVDINGKPAGASTGGTPANPAGDGKAACSGVSLAMAGALTGANAALGINIIDGAKVALDQHNKANPNCQVKMTPFDTEGDPQKATQVVPQIISDTSIIGLLGPAFSGETKAVGSTLHQANLLSLTASATNVALTTNGWTNFFRGSGQRRSAGSRGRQLPQGHARAQEDLRRSRTTPTTVSAWRRS